jgi:hypothetical protein
MTALNLPFYQFKTKLIKDKTYIFDPIRKKYILLTPEEWVRQNFVNYLQNEKKYPQSRVINEIQIELNGLKKRCDTLILNAELKPVMIIEYKAPTVEINQNTFDQAAVYNEKLKVKYLIISNGINHYCCQINLQSRRYNFLDHIPEYETILSTETI